MLSCAASRVCAPEVFEQKSGFDNCLLTRHWFSATFTRNEEHMGGTFDLVRVLGFLWNDCICHIDTHEETGGRHTYANSRFVYTVSETENDTYDRA